MGGWRTIRFFATGCDLAPILQAIEESWPVRYVQTGLFVNPEPPEFATFTTLPNFGSAPTGDQGHEPHYLLVPSTTRIRPRRIPQTAGGVRFAVDYLAGSGIASVRCGGVYGTNCVIAGELSTRADDVEGTAIFNVGARRLRKAFDRVNAYWVGPEASALLEAGARLTGAVQRPTEYDLRRE